MLNLSKTDKTTAGDIIGHYDVRVQQPDAGLCCNADLTVHSAWYSEDRNSQFMTNFTLVNIPGCTAEHSIHKVAAWLRLFADELDKKREGVPNLPLHNER